MLESTARIILWKLGDPNTYIWFVVPSLLLFQNTLMQENFANAKPSRPWKQLLSVRIWTGGL